MARLSEKQILEALAAVQDPDLKRDIVSLGFVRNLVIKGDDVRFDVELTTPACPVKQELQQRCVAVVEALGARQVSVNMTARVRQAPTGAKRPLPGIANILAIASGKGGVGKSTLCANLALALSRTGARVGILDCDFYGPSIPSLFGVHARVQSGPGERIMPHHIHGLKLMSIGFLVGRDQAVSWRGPMLHKMLNQLLFSVAWGELDYLLLDLPPGTGDVQLSLAQSVPVAAAVLVTTPQEVALRDVEKGIAMFRTTKVPVLGVIENMSWYQCGKCAKQHYIFKRGGAADLARRMHLPLLGEIPLDVSVPSPLGLGEPLMVRDDPGPAGAAFVAAAGAMVARLSILSESRPEAGPYPMEV